MKKIIVFISIMVIISFSCQNGLLKTDEKLYVTTIKGTVFLNGQSLSNAKITAVGDTTTSQSNGSYYISIIHNGSFQLTASYSGPDNINPILSETINSTESILSKNIYLIYNIP